MGLAGSDIGVVAGPGSDAAARSRTGARRLTRRAAMLAGLALLGCAAVLMLAGPAAPARAAGLTPCATSPTGPVVTLDGEATLDIRAAGRKALRRSGVRRSLIHPANSLTGRATFPVKKVRFGTTSKVWLKGGIRFKRGRRQAVVRNLLAVVPKNRKLPSRVEASLGGRRVVLYRLGGERRAIRRGVGELDLIGAKARLGAAAASALNRGLGLRRGAKRNRLPAGLLLDRFDLSATYFVTTPDDPVGETPVEPPLPEQPSGAATVGSATVTWELRDSWVNYVNTGSPIKADGGVEPGPPLGPDNLIYSYSFPFAAGWVAPESGAGDSPARITGSGSLAFRLCEHTINFKVIDPEIELSDDVHSRMIFRVDGLDGTAFPNRRAVMVKLRPGAASAHTVTTTDGQTTVTWEKIPGYIPAEGTGIFANFYPAYDPANGAPGSGFTEATRPDRFGFLTLSYTYPTPEP